MRSPQNNDVKNHLSPGQRDGKRLYRAVGPSDASGLVPKKTSTLVITELPPQFNPAQTEKARPVNKNGVKPTSTSATHRSTNA
jgi:hypothetical protein